MPAEVNRFMCINRFRMWGNHKCNIRFVEMSNSYVMVALDILLKYLWQNRKVCSWVGWLVVIYGISTHEAYSMANSDNKYIDILFMIYDYILFESEKFVKSFKVFLYNPRNFIQHYIYFFSPDEC